jgi:hypothetical protein
MAGWRLVLPVLERVRALRSLPRLMCRGGRSERDRDREQQALLAHSIYRRLPVVGDNCLERSLLLYRFLSEAGVEPTLVIGARRGTPSIIAHAWVTVEGRAIDSGAKNFKTIVAFGRDGKPASSHGVPLSRAAPST